MDACDWLVSVIDGDRQGTPLPPLDARSVVGIQTHDPLTIRAFCPDTKIIQFGNPRLHSHGSGSCAFFYAIKKAIRCVTLGDLLDVSYGFPDPTFNPVYYIEVLTLTKYFECVF